MIEYKLGCNFDMKLLDEIIELNKINPEVQITEVYGSDRAHAALTARPEFRVQDISAEYFEEFVKKAKENGINFNYTMNSIYPYGSKVQIAYHEQEIIDFVHWLENIGVYRITVANPIMLEIIRNKAHSNIEIELSTIAHVDTVTQIKYYHDVYRVNKICCNLNKNRNFKFLKAAADYCNKNGILFELMANEFCAVAGNGYTTHCIYRDSCYMCHATNHTREDAMLLDEYPMKFCTQSRSKDIVTWIRSRWIRPEDIKKYHAIGINHFKLTGRTGTTEYITKIARAYITENFEGNLIELWKPLESITDGKTEAEHDPLFYIDNKKLDGFIDFFMETGHNCDDYVCGETCTYCHKFFDEHIKEA